MFIACEIIEGRCYMLDGGGNVYCVEIGYDIQPQMQQVGIMLHDEARNFMMHRFERFHDRTR